MRLKKNSLFFSCLISEVQRRIINLGGERKLCEGASFLISYIYMLDVFIRLMRQETTEAKESYSNNNDPRSESPGFLSADHKYVQKMLNMRDLKPLVSVTDLGTCRSRTMGT